MINHPVLNLSASTLTVICVGIAMVMDLRWRRIPNWLTLPAVAAGLGLWLGFLGWKGLALSAGGMLAAPLLLVLLHLGRGPGMGDIKLAAGVGSLLGPRLSPIAMLLAGVAGGLIALCIQLRSGGPLKNMLSPFLVGVPGFEGWTRTDRVVDGQTAVTTVPYAIAIGIGVLLALAVSWCTNGESWLR